MLSAPLDLPQIVPNLRDDTRAEPKGWSHPPNSIYQVERSWVLTHKVWWRLKILQLQSCLRPVILISSMPLLVIIIDCIARNYELSDKIMATLLWREKYKAFQNRWNKFINPGRKGWSRCNMTLEDAHLPKTEGTHTWSLLIFFPKHWLLAEARWTFAEKFFWDQNYKKKFLLYLLIPLTFTFLSHST